jgi:MFS family permease
MNKSAFLFGIASFFLFLAIALLFPLCGLCIAVLIGAAAGWLAAYWSKPPDENSAASIGAVTGVIAGVGAVVGQTVGSILNARAIGTEGIIQFWEAFGFQGLPPITEGQLLVSAISAGACCGVVNVAIMAGFGALAGFLYFRNSSPSHPPNIEY